MRAKKTNRPIRPRPCYLLWTSDGEHEIGYFRHHKYAELALWGESYPVILDLNPADLDDPAHAVQVVCWDDIDPPGKPHCVLPKKPTGFCATIH